MKECWKFSIFALDYESIQKSCVLHLGVQVEFLGDINHFSPIR